SEHHSSCSDLSFVLLLRSASVLICSAAFLFFFLLIRLPPKSTLFPYTTLFRSYVSPAYHLLEGFPFIQEPPSGDLQEKHTGMPRSEERFSRNAETDLVCRLLLEKKNGILSCHQTDCRIFA